MESTITLRQAGEKLGVEPKALEQLISDGHLPEARRSPDVGGERWLLPASKLGDIAKRHGWVIDLRPDEDSPQTHSLVPIQRQASAPPRATTDTPEPGGNPLSVAEVLDRALLDRLLGVHADKTRAVVEASQTRSALADITQKHERVTRKLEIERRERTISGDRYREERSARLVADAKVAELRQRVSREMALAEAERIAKDEAVQQRRAAEEDATKAIATMGWLARRRFRRTYGG